jgi:hypothetical protein
MVRSRAVQVRFTEEQLALIERLGAKLGIDTQAGVIKHAIARLAFEEKVPTRGRRTAKEQ